MIRNPIAEAEVKENSDAGEMLILRSRVEQQSDLIMMLKQRNDDLSNEIVELKSTVSKAGIANVKLANDKDTVVRELSVLQDRFDTLAKQHQQMIEIKDEHKTARNKLKLQVDALTSEVKTIADTLDAQHKSEKDSLRTKLDSSKAELARVREEFAKSTAIGAAKLEASQKESSTFRAKYDALAKQHDALKIQLSKEQKQAASTIKRLTADEKAASDAAKRSSAKAESLSDELHASEGAARAATDEVQKLKVRLKKESASTQVANANEELQSAVHSMQSIQQEYDAYKKYSSDLLKKEKEMNQRLRHLHASGP